MPGVVLVTLLLALSTAPAQNTPRIGYVYPAGGRQGATAQITVGGQYLGAVSNVYLSGSGIQAAVVEYNRPMNQKEFNDLREEMRVLQEKRNRSFRNNRRADGGAAASTNVWTTVDEKRLTEIREKIARNPPNRNASPAMRRR